MKTKFVKTNNVLKMLGALGELEKRHPVVPGLALIHGHQGFGKTMATHWYAVQHNCVYLRAQGAWTVNWLLMDLSASLGIAPEGVSRQNFRNIKHELYSRPRLVLLDEADYVIRRREMLDTVRDLHDGSGAPVCLVGMAGAREAVARKSPQFWSRVSQEVEFAPLTVDDVAIIANDLADMSLTPEQSREIRRRTEGNFRKTVVILAKIEQLCKTNKTSISAQVIDLAGKGMAANE
jgi:hypothetical protein